MSSSTAQNKDQSRGQGRRGQGRQRHRRNHHRNNDGARRGNRYGGPSGRGRGSRMPRSKPKPSFWQRLLAIFGLGNRKPTEGRKRATPSTSPASSRVRVTVTNTTSQSRTKQSRPKSPPERVEVTSSRLYVGNLSYDATESDLVELFNGVGTVANAEVIYNSRTQRSKGYAFVDMQSLDEALRAVEELHDKEYMGRKMIVSGAKDPKQREVALPWENGWKRDEQEAD